MGHGGEAAPTDNRRTFRGAEPRPYADR